MNTEKIDQLTAGIDKGSQPLPLGEKLAWFGIVFMIFYLIFIDK